MSLFDITTWRDEWQGMPAFPVADEVHRRISVVCQSDYDFRLFCETVGIEKAHPRTKEFWFPPPEWRGAIKRFRYVGNGGVPRYPIYIPSKGRWELRPTVRTLEQCGVPYHLVVEPSEYAAYAAVVDPANILVLPQDFSQEGSGSILARNWIWQHAIDHGHARHWQIDDNVYSFLRVIGNARVRVVSTAPFCAFEDFTDRYENVALSGFNYFNHRLMPGAAHSAPYRLNARVYSMMLINSSLPHRFRGRYNEDTDFSLRVLKDGWCTILFNIFVGDKQTSMRGIGGNTDTIYAEDDERLEFAESLQRQHPDVAKVVRRYGRWHHEVDYKQFDNRLIKKPNGSAPDGIDEYGLELELIDEEQRDNRGGGRGVRWYGEP